MPTANQKYSTRVHSRRQLGRAKEHLTEVSKVMKEVGCRYADALPMVADACIQVNAMVDLLQTLIEDMRTNI